ncbi:uncharacterized protein LOC123928913 isoform X2 [Meles meles]|uniref:uncharacterized protein LOC123928913 isoform X2 n=1 Tax=Meles meles TaxID=9662 RepID=UPI001E69AB51|nr:uncharacterized protein LOC123928913 isoform X2 [Meles meles]
MTTGRWLRVGREVGGAARVTGGRGRRKCPRASRHAGQGPAPTSAPLSGPGRRRIPGPDLDAARKEMRRVALRGDSRGHCDPAFWTRARMQLDILYYLASPSCSCVGRTREEPPSHSSPLQKSSRTSNRLKHPVHSCSESGQEEMVYTEGGKNANRSSQRAEVEDVRLQPNVGTHNPEIKSHTFCRLSQPGTPNIRILESSLTFGHP